MEKIEELPKKLKHNYPTESRLYRVWHGMIQRTNNPEKDNYHYYGGRGITCCEKWESFNVFADWALGNGYKDNLEMDRIDNDKGYQPDNVRFIPKYQNMQNTGLSKKNTSGVKGVSFNKYKRKWMATITIEGRQIQLGAYIKKEEAVISRKTAEKLLFGENSFYEKVKNETVPVEEEE